MSTRKVKTALHTRLRNKLLEQNKQIEELKKQNSHLRKQNLKMRLDFEVLLDNPEGIAAGKIMSYYRRLRIRREEALQLLSN